MDRKYDEQELQQVYRAAYKAYSSTTILYTILLVVLLLGELFFNIGITPILVLGIIWLTQTIIYQRESLKNSPDQSDNFFLIVRRVQQINLEEEIFPVVLHITVVEVEPAGLVRNGQIALLVVVVVVAQEHQEQR